MFEIGACDAPGNDTTAGRRGQSYGSNQPPAREVSMTLRGCAWTCLPRRTTAAAYARAGDGASAADAHRGLSRTPGATRADPLLPSPLGGADEPVASVDSA